MGRAECNALDVAVVSLQYRKAFELPVLRHVGIANNNAATTTAATVLAPHGAREVTLPQPYCLIPTAARKYAPRIVPRQSLDLQFVSLPYQYPPIKRCCCEDEHSQGG